MNGPHDLGGQMGFGPIAPEPNEPVFHSEWERRAFGVSMCSGAHGKWSIDRSRFMRESIPPAIYLAASYYEIWIRGLEANLERVGLVTREELEAGRPLGGEPAKPPLRAADVPGMLSRRGSYERPIERPARFAVGDSVRTRNMHPTHHTRLPRYARGKRGTIIAVNGSHVFPDTAAQEQGDNPDWLYTVEFAAAELWGEGADNNSSVSIDAWESYLEPA